MTDLIPPQGVRRIIDIDELQINVIYTDATTRLYAEAIQKSDSLPTIHTRGGVALAPLIVNALLLLRESWLKSPEPKPAIPAGVFLTSDGRWHVEILDIEPPSNTSTWRFCGNCCSCYRWCPPYTTTATTTTGGTISTTSPAIGAWGKHYTSGAVNPGE